MSCIIIHSLTTLLRSPSSSLALEKPLCMVDGHWGEQCHNDRVGNEKDFWQAQVVITSKGPSRQGNYHRQTPAHAVRKCHFISISLVNCPADVFLFFLGHFVMSFFLCILFATDEFVKYVEGCQRLQPWDHPQLQLVAVAGSVFDQSATISLANSNAGQNANTELLKRFLVPWNIFCGGNTQQSCKARRATAGSPGSGSENPIHFIP